MKATRAIVLSYDRNHVFVDHMIQKYEKLWPESPFIFRVPYNDKYPGYLKEKYGDKIELVRTPSKIKNTVLKLIEDIGEQEWIYWCIDDKYVDKLLLHKYNALTNWVLSIDDPQVQGVSLARARGLFDDGKLDYSNVIETPLGGNLIARRFYNQFWLHQFFRVNVVKTLFKSFPDREFRAKEMDEFIKGKVTKDGEFYVHDTNLVVFGESASRGKITKNAIKSFKKEKLEIPNGFHSNRSKKSLKIGRIKIIEKIKDILTKP